MSDDDYGFEYSDDDQEEEDVNIENRYYNAKGDLADDVDAALSGFKEVVSMEEEKGEWGFKVNARPRTLARHRARTLHAARGRSRGRALSVAWRVLVAGVQADG